MKNKSRRILNRLLFTAGILLPSFIIGGTLMLRHTQLGQAWLRGQWIEQLSAATHSNIDIGRVHFLHPGKTTLEDVRVTDKESGRLICRANHIEVEQGDEETRLNIHTLQIPDTSPVGWINWWNEHVLAIKQTQQFKIKIGLTLLNDLPVEELNSIAALIQLDASSSQMTVNWGSQPTPLAVQISRTHQHPVATTILLQTNGNSLPLQVVTDALPTTVDLGRHATFNGQLISKYAPGQFTSEVDFAAEGKIENIDLSSIFPTSDGKSITGTASLDIKRAVCNNNQWKRLSAVMTGHSGMIARNWLPELASKLQLRWMGDIKEEHIPYESLHCEFSWDPTGFTLKGESDGAHIGAILRHKNGPILGDRPDAVIRSATLQDALNR